VADREELASELSALEDRVSDEIFTAVREQMRSGDPERARQLERDLAKVRRHLAKAAAILRGSSLEE
jgi:hypothetical protein